MDWLIDLLGREAGASPEDITAALEALKAAKAEMGEKPDEAMATMNAQMVEIGTSLGLAESATATAIIAAAKAARSGKASDDLVTLNAEIAQMKADRAKERSEAWLDGQIRSGVGVPRDEALRDSLISMHMEDAARAEMHLAAFPRLGHSGLTGLPPKAKSGEITLNAEQIGVAAILGIPQDKYLAQLKADAAKQETL
ncbi:MAG: phage protease, partial [Jannaschia sp.]